MGSPFIFIRLLQRRDVAMSLARRASIYPGRIESCAFHKLFGATLEIKFDPHIATCLVYRSSRCSSLVIEITREFIPRPLVHRTLHSFGSRNYQRISSSFIPFFEDIVSHCRCQADLSIYARRLITVATYVFHVHPLRP